MRAAITGNILTPQGWVHGDIGFDTHIAVVKGGAVDPASNTDDYILPGFIDLHVHGGGGKDVMEGGDAVHTIAAIHAKHGTTSMLATTMTAPAEDIDLALRGIGKAAAQRSKGEARVLGAHLEGPFINSGKLGAQPPYARSATLAEICRCSRSRAAWKNSLPPSGRSKTRAQCPSKPEAAGRFSSAATASASAR